MQQLKKKKAPPAPRTYHVVLDGDLEGFELVMRGMSTRDLIMVSSGEVPTGEAMEMVLGHVVAHNFDLDDLHDLDAWITTAILSAWAEAVKDSALPPEHATS